MTSPMLERLAIGALRGARRGERVVELLELLLEELGIDPGLAGPETIAGAGPALTPAQRSARYRERQRSRHGGVTAERDGPRDDRDEVDRHVTRHVTAVTRGEGGKTVNGSTRGTLTHDFSEELRERERPDRHVTRHVTAVTETVTREVPVTLSMPITPELRAIAGMQAVQDVEGAWSKFTGHYNGRTLEVAGAWQKWCVNERNRERTDRDRKAKLGPGRGGPTDPPAPRSKAEEQAALEEADRAAQRVLARTQKRPQGGTP